MTGKIFNIRASGDLAAMRETGFFTEDNIQIRLERYPDRLAGDQISTGSPRCWLLVMREMRFADQQDGTNRWWVDQLFIDQDGT